MQQYSIPEEKADSIAEYMAALILKYDDNYTQDLIPQEVNDHLDELEEGNSSDKDFPIATITPSQSNQQSNNEEINNQEEYTLSEVFGNKNFEIQYLNYKVAETYPDDTENAYFYVEPRNENYHLIVASFQVKNISKKEKSLNLSKEKIQYKLDVNVGTIYKPLLTLLENDLQYLDITLAAGKTSKVLLIYEVSKETDMSDINLIISNNNKTEIIEMK
jgi:hypothetical protein